MAGDPVGRRAEEEARNGMTTAHADDDEVVAARLRRLDDRRRGVAGLLDRLSGDAGSLELPGRVSQFSLEALELERRIDRIGDHLAPAERRCDA